MAVWESIFSHDMRRYQRSLYQRIHEVSTLILGERYTPAFHIWVITPTHQGFSPNLIPLANVGESLIASAQTRIEQGYRPTDKEWQLYGDVALYVLYYRYEGHFYKVVTR